MAIGVPAAWAMEPPREGAFEPSLAVVDDGFVVAWYERERRDGAVADIYLQRFDERRAARSPRIRLTSGTADAYEADVVAWNGISFVVWYEKQRESGALTAHVGAWDLQGRRLWTQQLSRSSVAGRNPAVRVQDGTVFTTWIEEAPDGAPRVIGQWFDHRGMQRSRPIVAGSASRTTWSLNVAIDRLGQAWVAFDSDLGLRQNELFLARIDARSAQLSRISEDDGFASKYPDVRIQGERLALTWFDERDGNQEVYLAVGPVSLDEALTRSARRVTRNEGQSFGAYIAWNEDKLGLAWCDDSRGRYAVYFQQFDAEGAVLTLPQRVSDELSHTWVPTIQPWRSSFALAWTQTAGVRTSHDRGSAESKLTLRLLK